MLRTSVQKLDNWGNIGLLIHRFRFTCIIALLVLAAVLGYFAPSLPSVLGGDGFETEGDYQETRKVLEKEFKQSQDTLFLVFQKKKNVSSDQFHAAIKQIVQKIQKEETYASFHHPLQDPAMMHKDIAYGTILLKGQTIDELTANTVAFAKRIQKESNSAVQVSPTGFPGINHEINARSQSDLKKAEMIGLPIAFLVLLMSFGNLMASILPILNGGLSVAATMGILYMIGQQTELSIFVLNVTPMVGFALSIDFALLFVNRFREELEQREVAEAIAATYQTAGRAILFSGLCVFVGLSGLFFFRIEYMQSIALSGMIVVIMSILFSLTLLPAVLSLMGKRLKQLGQKRKSAAFWRAFAHFVMKRSVMMTAVVLIGIALCLLPLRGAKFEFPGIESLPKYSDTRIAYERYETEFNPLLKHHADVTILVEMKQSMTERKSLEKLEAIVKELSADPDVYKVTSAYSMLGNMPSGQLYALLQSQQQQVLPALQAYTHGNRALVQVMLQAKPKGEQAKQWVRNFKDRYKQPDVTYLLGGMTTFEQELQDEVMARVAIAMTVIFGSTFLILMIAFRSLIIPLKAIVMNVLSLSATIGIIVWLFQGGRFGLEQSTIMFVLPIFIFGLVFGLSMDYEVFLISRIYELYKETKNNDTATLEGLVSTGRIITSAALIMIVVTGAFVFTDILPVKQMGLGVALAIFLDATVIRLLLVPSLMKMLGDWNWWFFTKWNLHKEAKGGV